MKINIPETAIHVSYLPWLARVDALIGEPARLDLARHTSFLQRGARASAPTRRSPMPRAVRCHTRHAGGCAGSNRRERVPPRPGR